MRVPFSQVFNVNRNGSVSPKTTVVIGGATMSPGMSFWKGAFFGGVEIATHVGKDLEVKDKGGVIILKSIYP